MTSSNLTDIEIIKKCLIKHNTSARGLGKDDKGIGLDRILALLNNRGFIRIKTGSSCIYRNLISSPYKQVGKDNVDEMELYDWKTNSSDHFSKFHYAVGSVISIIYPLSYTTNNE
jgi:hypothetical protein